MKSRNLLFVLVFLFSATSIFAQEIKEEKKETKSVFSLDGEFRNRFEYAPSAGGRNLIVHDGTSSAAYFWQRSRIKATYKTDKLETKFSIQDVRPFGENDGVFKSNNGTSVSLSEAWVKYYFVNNDSRKFGLKIGRQELFNSDGRLVWNKNWDHYGGAYDAFALECVNKDAGVKWNLAFSLNSADQAGTAYAKLGDNGKELKKYRTFGLFNFSKKFGDAFTLNITDLMEGYDEKTAGTEANYVKNTIGFNPVIKVADLTFNGSFYYQHGTPNTFIGTNADPVKYAAMMYTANVAYKIGKISTGLGYDNYSGDTDGTDNKNQVFLAPYQGAHKFFGNTDHHLKLFGKGLGLQDINVKLNVAIDKKTKVGLGFHVISFANDAEYTDATSGNTVVFKSVGNNVDLAFSRVLGKKMSVSGGYSLLLPTEDYINSMSWGQALDAKTHGWAWVMFSFKPNFLKVTK